MDTKRARQHSHLQRRSFEQPHKPSRIVLVETPIRRRHSPSDRPTSVRHESGAHPVSPSAPSTVTASAPAPHVIAAALTLPKTSSALAGAGTWGGRNVNPDCSRPALAQPVIATA
jgi:hypothetical protein